MHCEKDGLAFNMNYVEQPIPHASGRTIVVFSDT